MGQAVILKSSRYGIHVKLDPDLDFGALTDAVVEKFVSSATFFKDASFAISFEGRTLSKEEEYALVEAIEEKTKNHILCILDKEPKEQVSEEETTSLMQPVIHYGDLQPEEELHCDGDLVIFGDVPTDASVTSKNNIFIIGNLYGLAHAGKGNPAPEDSFVCAFFSPHATIRIGALTYVQTEKKTLRLSLLNKKENAFKIARIKEGMVFVENIAKPLSLQ